MHSIALCDYMHFVHIKETFLLLMFTVLYILLFCWQFAYCDTFVNVITTASTHMTFGLGLTSLSLTTQRHGRPSLVVLITCLVTLSQMQDELGRPQFTLLTPSHVNETKTF